MAAINQLDDKQSRLFRASFQEHCFTLAQTIEANLSTSFCETILTDRLAIAHSIDPNTKILSIASCIETTAYQKALEVDISSWPKEYRQIESLAIECFGHWTKFWCEYEIYKIKQRYPLQACSPSYDLPMDESRYQSEVIEEIKASKQHYLTLHHQSPMLLSDAIALINLSTLVCESKWYEILPCLKISMQGCHFVLTHHSLENCNLPSIIVSSARIQDWSTAEQWLYFTPFFRNRNWTLCLPDNLNERCVQLDLYRDAFNFDETCNQSFEDGFSQHIFDKQKICEVLRLTVSGTATQGTFFLFLAQKRIMPLLDEKQIKVAYTVIEQPWMIRFYETLQHGGYFHSSCRKVDDSNHYTYKGFWEVPSLRIELDSLSYQSYKRRVINQVKKAKEIDYV